MSLFIDKQNRRKSPLALAAFGAALLYLGVFALLYAVLAEPLYEHVRLGSPAASTAAHGAIIALAGTAVCCLLFLLEDKRVAPLGFAGLAVVLGMFCAAALMLEGEERGLMLRLIGLYGAAALLVGNAVAWPLYWKLRPKAPRRRKTVRQELMEAAAKEAAGPERGPAQRTEAVRPPAQDAAGAPAPGAPEAEAPPPEEALPGPAASGRPGSARSEEEEAMLFYMDDGDEESDD